MWKAARRPDHKISQSYNDGVVRIYRVTDSAPAGYQPREELTLITALCYEERRVGVARYYSAKQAQEEVKRVLRVQHLPPDVNPTVTGRVYKAVTEDGSAYRVDLVQSVPDVWPPSADLTLVAYRQGAAT